MGWLHSAFTLGGQPSGKTSLANFATGVGAILDAPHPDGAALVKRLTRLMGLKPSALLGEGPLARVGRGESF